MTTYLGSTYDVADAPKGPLGAIDELKQRRIWVAWKIVMRADAHGNMKPTKPPVNPHTGFGASHSDPSHWGTYEQAAALAERRSLPGVGIVLQDDDDLVGIDLDKCRNAETGQIDEWVQEIVDFGETYAEVSPSGTGVRLIARGKVPATVKCDPAHVEIYRSQRYLTVTEEHLIGTPDEINPAPRTLAALMERVERLKPRPADPPPPAHLPAHHAPAPATPSAPLASGSDFFRNVNDKALASLASWVPVAFPSARFQAGTGAYRVSSRALGRSLQEDLSLSPEGIKDFGVADMGDPRLGARTPIDVLIEWCGHASPLDAGKWLCDRMGVTPEALGWGEHNAQLVALGAATARVLIEQADGALVDPTTGEIVSSPRAEDQDAEDLPEHLFDAPGLVGEIARYTLDTAMYPKRAFAIATALSVVSTLIGRYWCSPTESATHLYIFCVGPSGSGKENGLKVAKKLFDAAGFGGMIGPGDFMSGTAISNHIVGNPLTLCVLDEFQMMVKKVHHKKASAHEQAISKIFRELYNINNGTFRTAAWASKASESVHAPSFNILAAGAKQETWESFNADSIKNGFINRFLIMAAEDARQRDPVVSFLDPPPPTIVARMKAIFAGGALNDPNDKTCGGTLTVLNARNVVTIRKIEWADARAKAAYDAYQEKLRVLRKDDPDAADFVARSAEMSTRVAAALAAGRSIGTPRVTVEDFEWAREIVDYSANTMRRNIGVYLAENDAQANANRVLRIILKKGGHCTRREIMQSLKHYLRPREVEDTFNALMDAGTIARETTKRENGGHEKVIYRVIGKL